MATAFENPTAYPKKPGWWAIWDAWRRKKTSSIWPKRRPVSSPVTGAPDFWWWGTGPAGKQLSAYGRKKNLSQKLVMAGSLSGQDLSDAYAAMDLFVFSSQSETQGMVLLEAMAAGKPVVALDASGVREVVSDGQNGRLLPQDASRQAFADAIEEIFQDPDTAGHWRRGALETARNLSREVCARRLEALYHAVLAEYGASSDRVVPAELISWDSLLEGIKLEWELLLNKTEAAVDAIRAGEFPEKA